MQNGIRLLQISVGDIVVINKDGMVPTTWRLGHIVGKGRLVRVANVKPKNGIYKRPVHTLALLLPKEH